MATKQPPQDQPQPTYTLVEITLTGNNFNYAPGYLQVHRGDTVAFKCNRAFTVKFLYGTPFGTVTTFYSSVIDGTSDTGTVAATTALQVYHYTVTATDDTGVIHLDGGCPTIDVL
jgi:hypothetical protein